MRDLLNPASTPFAVGFALLLALLAIAALTGPY